jgi:subtilisin family serine protease
VPQCPARLLAAALAVLIAAGGAQARVSAPAGPRASRLAQGERALRMAAPGSAKLDAALARAAIAAPGARTQVVVAPAHGRVAAARRAVARLGGRVQLVEAGLVQAQLPARELTALSRLRVVRRVTAPVRPVELGVSGEGVDATNARAWHAVGLTGKGVKVAIIDAGFAGLAAKQSAGAVTGNATTVDYCGGHVSDDTHGTAVAEIVSAEAPGAQLYLICVDTEVALAAAEKYAQANGVRVISMSLGWYGTWSGDGRGPAGTPDATVAAARAAGILWVNAAGNDGVGHWRGTFSDTNGDGFSELSASGDETDSFTLPQADGVCVFMRWNEWPHATHDYDLLLIREPSGVVVGGSTEDQFDLHTEPSESFCYINASRSTLTVGFAIAAPHGSPGPLPTIDVFAEARPFSARLEYATVAGSISDPAASPNALAVGATCWQTNELEFYSSEGPTVDGRLKPDLAAPDSVSSSVYGPFVACGRSGFAGTSASAPHAAGAAALVAQRFPTFGPERLQAYLLAHARDLGSPGPDDAFGAGELSLPPFEAPEVTATNVSAVRARSARVSAVVSPLESSTTVTIELGRTESYGASVKARVSAGAGVDASATASLSGLRPATTYHVRAVATGFGGTVAGPDRTFRTARSR